MQTDDIIDEISALSRQLAILRQKLTEDPVRPGMLATAARDLFRAQMAPDAIHDIGEETSDFGSARFEYLFGSGFHATIRQPLKAAPQLSPPDHERRFSLTVETQGSSPWLTLRLPVGTAEFAGARTLWWELAGHADPAFDLRAVLRLYSASGAYTDHPAGQGALYPRRSVLAGELSLAALSEAGEGPGATQALYFFLQPRSGQQLTLDYLIAHVD